MGTEPPKGRDISLTGVERFFDHDTFIVSKTDTKGIITYANRVFLDVAGYSEDEVIGKPHNLIRHPAMPKCVFKLLWDRCKAGEEVFAYVNNRCKNGDHYWVLAHVTPSFNDTGEVVGFHSNRRVPERSAVETMSRLYELLLAKENEHTSPKEAIAASTDMLMNVLKDKGVTYDAFIFAL